jgi:hypothetical protein
MPASIAIRIITMLVNVRCAVFTTGSRNACTPLLTASTPVIAVQPLENAFNKSQTLTAAAAGGSGGGATAGSGAASARTVLTNPQPSMMNIVATKRYVGATNTAPVSRTPRKLTIVMNSKIIRHSAKVYGCHDGNADMSAPTPAEMPTAAVST